MKFFHNSKVLTNVKKIFRVDFIIFAVVSLMCWILMLYGIGNSISHHSHYNEHTRQALAWQEGRITLESNIKYLEIAHYKDKYYVSFPPIPTLIEFPFALILGLNTPNTFTMLVFTWVGMLFSFFILLKLTDNRILSYLMSFSFFWGSTVLYLSLEGAVWHQGQLYGLFFAIAALLILLYAQKPFPLFFGAFCLALAVGCRPFYLFMAPFYGYHAWKRFPRIRTLVFVITGLMPPGIFYALYNYIRFDSIFEIGHSYLPWGKTLPHGVISFFYFNRNIYHALVHPPEWNEVKGIVEFNGMGTGLWFSSPVILLGFAFFLRYLFVGCMKCIKFVKRLKDNRFIIKFFVFVRSIKFVKRLKDNCFIIKFSVFVSNMKSIIKLKNNHFIKEFFARFLSMADEKIPVLEIVFSFFTIVAIWLGLLLYESNGWFQFGYRFSVDLIPILLFLFGRTFKKPYIFLVPICQFVIIVNIYGAFWFYILRH